VEPFYFTPFGKNLVLCYGVNIYTLFKNLARLHFNLVEAPFPVLRRFHGILWKSNIPHNEQTMVYIHIVGAKVDLQTQRANTRFNVKACQPI